MEPAQIIVFVVVILIAIVSAISKKKKLPEFPQKNSDNSSHMNSNNPLPSEKIKLEVNEHKYTESSTFSNFKKESNYNWNDGLALNQTKEDDNSNVTIDTSKKDSDKTDLRKFIIMSEILKTKF